MCLWSLIQAHTKEETESRVIVWSEFEGWIEGWKCKCRLKWQESLPECDHIWNK